jgi:16S rRNA (guanine966-N2)-methyltransferase
MRIVGGALRGRRLAAPAGLATRPTADRVRESVFNILGGRIQAEQVLDLFAGTGALGIEALSRGAGEAIFVDCGRAALAALRRNIQALHLEDRIRIVVRDIRNGLAFLANGEVCVDLVFMDPPYDRGMILKPLADLCQSGILAPGARIVIEHSPHEQITPLPRAVYLSDRRKYGKTLVSFLDRVL